jgi:hypothetical protein
MVVHPLDALRSMQALPLAAQLSGGFDSHYFVAAARQGRGVATGACADVDNGKGSSQASEAGRGTPAQT